MSSSSVVGTTDATMAVQSLGSGRAGTSAPHGAADFLAAILQALAPDADRTQGGAAAGQNAAGEPGAAKAGAAADGKADGQGDGQGDGRSDAVPDAAALGLVALAAPLAGVVATPGVAVAGGGAGQANVGQAAVAAPTGTTGDIRMPGAAAADPALSAGPSAGPGRRAGHAHADSAVDGTASGTSSDLRLSGDAASIGQAGAGSSSGTPTDGGAGQGGQQPAGAPVTAVLASGPTHATQPASGPAPAAGPAAPVTSQVFPEVTSLVSRGDGTHRITLTLKPEALGEVRVVMTVRDGAVHVRLAAGQEAQQALLSGSSELTRLLEHAGATDTRIVVRDLVAGPASATGASDDLGGSPDRNASNNAGGNLGQAPGSGPGAGSAHPQDQHAGTRAEHPATEGEPDTGTRTNQSRPVQPVTRARTSGVDVTM